MPWKPKDAKRFSKKVEARMWAEIANRVLKRTGDEGMAIRVANVKARKKKKGGGKR